MGKITVFNALTVDGFYEGLNHELDWHQVDDEFNEFAIKQIGEFDAILFGRMTYEMMFDYWPTEGATNDDPVVAKMMNDKPKYVFSNSLSSADWNNTTLLSGNLQDSIQQLKANPGKDIIIFGSGMLTAGLTELGLVDEFRLMFMPVLLGQGHTLTATLTQRVNLELIQTRTFQNGNILLTYFANY
jgi:dihydrofolate reductase